MDGEKEKMRTERDGGEERETPKEVNNGQDMTGKETPLQRETGRDTPLEEKRRGRGKMKVTGGEEKRGQEMRTGLERRTDTETEIETEIGREKEKLKEAEIETETETGTGTKSAHCHHLHHHPGVRVPTRVAHFKAASLNPQTKMTSD